VLSDRQSHGDEHCQEAPIAIDFKLRPKPLQHPLAGYSASVEAFILFTWFTPS
jgi:hypothetical protein